MTNINNLIAQFRANIPARCLASLFVAVLVSRASDAPAQPGIAEDLKLEQLLGATVVSATLHEQSVREAPAAVTVITAEQIRRFGYRTLGEAVGSAAGFFETYDHTYQAVGTRGVSIPGDWQSRMLVLVDGHRMTDNLYSSGGGLGRDFPINMQLIKRIEIVRGPGSALYGSNGIFATINIITFAPDELPGTSVRLDVGTLGEKGVVVTTSARLGRVRALFSASMWERNGETDVLVPGLTGPEYNFGHARNVDNDASFQLFTRFLIGHWSFSAFALDRKKVQPVSWGEGIFGDSGTRAEDGRGVLAVDYTREWSETRRLVWRSSYDKLHSNYVGRYVTDENIIANNREMDRGDWLNTQLIYSFAAGARHSITTGADAKWDLRASIVNADVAPKYFEYTRMSVPDRSAGVFLQDEIRITPTVSAVVAARVDYSKLYSYIVSPKASLIWESSPATTLKAIVSQGMRNPSAYESFYSDGLLSVANPFLHHEQVNTTELILQHRIRHGLEASVDAYKYGLHNVIASEVRSDGLFQYQNLRRISANGVEVTLRASSGERGSELLVSASLQRTVWGDKAMLPNSPGFLGKLRASTPVSRLGLRIAGSLDYMSERRTGNGVGLKPVLLPGATISSDRFRGGLRFQAGVRNLTNVRYLDPVSFMQQVDSMPQLGRTAFVSLTWQQSER